MGARSRCAEVRPVREQLFAFFASALVPLSALEAAKLVARRSGRARRDAPHPV